MARHLPVTKSPPYDRRRHAELDPLDTRLGARGIAHTLCQQALKPRSREEYARCLRLHVYPTLGSKPLNTIEAPQVRTWHAKLTAAGVGQATIAKTYRILHVIFATAVDDELIRRNPCRIKKAGTEKANERPTATLHQVFAIAEAIQPRYRLLVLLAAFAQLRFGELVALRRVNVVLPPLSTADPPMLKITRATGEMEDGTQYDDDPKSEAGKRSVNLPRALRVEIEQHMAAYAQPGPDGRLFVGPGGATPRRRNFNRIWKRALKRAGVPDELGLHLHDLRHTGATWSAQSGATLKELMSRIGHASTRAAMIYQHATSDRDHAIAAALDALIEEARGDAAA
jgi:integrase